MLGRGMLACPGLAKQIKTHHQQKSAEQATAVALPWQDVVNLLLHFHQLSQSLYDPRYVGNRLKQWLGYLRRRYQRAAVLFEQVKRLRCANAIGEQLTNEYLYASK